MSSRVILHFSKEGSDMLFEWRWKNVSRRCSWQRNGKGSCLEVVCHFRSREARARTKFNALLRTMNVGSEQQATRKSMCWHKTGRAQLAIEATLQSAVGGNSEARPHAAEVDGEELLQARTDNRSGIQSIRRGDAGVSWWQLRRADVGARRRSTSCGSCYAPRHETSLTI